MAAQSSDSRGRSGSSTQGRHDRQLSYAVARIRFLEAQVEILRRKLGGNRVIPSPDDRAWLLAIGQELNHHVADGIGIVTPQTYCRWVEELRTGRKPRRVGRPKIVRNLGGSCQPLSAGQKGEISAVPS